MRSYRSVCTERASCCGAFRSWTFPSLLTQYQPPCSPFIFAVAGGGCVLILSVFGRWLLVGFRRFRRRCQGGGSIGQSPNSRPRLAVRDAKSKQVLRPSAHGPARNSSPPPAQQPSGTSSPALKMTTYKTAVIVRMQKAERKYHVMLLLYMQGLVMTTCSLESAMCEYGTLPSRKDASDTIP